MYPVSLLTSPQPPFGRRRALSLRSSGKLVSGSGELPCYKGRGGVRPGAGRPSRNDPRFLKRKRTLEKADKQTTPLPKRSRFGKAQLRAHPRGGLTERELEESRHNMLYAKLPNHEDVVSSHAESLKVQVSCSSIMLLSRKESRAVHCCS